MLRNRLYYRLKPMLPNRARLAVRRWFARRMRERCREVWPIMPGSEKPPPGWPGWPEGKKFALVLTHDVESPAGVRNIPKLIELEKRQGFSSSINLIPEGGYAVTPELRQEIARNGFELGVHDLHHDGRLFLTKASFVRNAAKINGYLSTWGAAGFRSGFMLRNLEWVHGLNIQYDASTFDTDPFEPQPGGQHTIFPFWVSGNGNHTLNSPETRSDITGPQPPHHDSPGYVELPYTLPQDSTLFLILRERHPDIWFQKLDWVAKHGGMALVNVHPDYIRFEGDADTGTTYPVKFYAAFLDYARQRYGEVFWHVKPGELASWYRTTLGLEDAEPGPLAASSLHRSAGSGVPQRVQPALAGKRIAVVLYSYYEKDPRPRREAEAAAKAGAEVDVLCLRRDPSLPWKERLNGVDVFRLPMKRRRDTKLTYAVQYLSFLLGALAFVSFRTLKRRYQLVHAHNMPDVLVFSALLPRLCGAKVLLDLHDPMPELFQAIYSLPANHGVVRLLRRLEKLSIAFAHQVLTPNSAFKDRFISRGCPPSKIEIVMNSPVGTMFHADGSPPPRPASAESDCVLMYHGLLVERHGLDLAIRAIAKLAGRLPRLKLHFYGDPTAYIEETMRLVEALNLKNVVVYHGFKPQAEIATALKSVDLGIIPNRLNPFTAINMPTRIFECLAMNKPVIVPRTKGIRDYFSEDALIFFEPGDIDDLAEKIEWAALHPADVQARLQKAIAVYREHRWEREEEKLTGVLQGLLAPESARPHLSPASKPPRADAP